MLGDPARRVRWRVLIVAALIVTPLSGVLGARLKDWTSIESEAFGYAIAYPRSVFTSEDHRADGEGHVFVSGDGQARLLVGAFPNTEETSLDEYRAYLLEHNYAGGVLDYAPVRSKWFVLSGTRDGTMFYERVSFTCGGRLINSWAMLYPASQRRFYDRVVEKVARSYTPGAGRDGECDLGST